VIYLIHFDRPYRHARHYLGFVESPRGLVGRLARHASGAGARLLAVVAAAGIGWRLVRTWADGTRAEERRLKSSRHAPRYCPICRLERNRIRRARRHNHASQ
jgi:hypothetical protein